MQNRIKALIRRREFYLIILGYPVMFFIFGHIRKNFVDWTTEHANYYGFVVFAIAILIVAMASLEIVTKLYSYNLQGDKLKMRQREGIEITKLTQNDR